MQRPFQKQHLLMKITEKLKNLSLREVKDESCYWVTKNMIWEDTRDKRADFTGQGIQSHHVAFAFLTAQCTSTPCHLKHRFPMAEGSNILMLCFSSREVRRQHGAAPRYCSDVTHHSCPFRQTSSSPDPMPLTCSAELLQQLKGKQVPATPHTKSKLTAPELPPSLQDKLLILFVITLSQATATCLFRPDYVTLYIPD